MRYFKRKLFMNYSWVGERTIEKLMMIMNEMVLEFFGFTIQKRLKLKGNKYFCCAECRARLKMQSRIKGTSNSKRFTCCVGFQISKSLLMTIKLGNFGGKSHERVCLTLPDLFSFLKALNFMIRELKRNVRYNCHIQKH